ncbi:hypothetical protein CcCBS67573_g07720 [Chytriomyces confervae]|uniref:Uncharacterized protein n=1 Tax=Chytriomyces confervae TaxID=246404 RepID=A0A507EU50_9FUNG|nr:hypothetical protein CcCBS67573_g07720 [Chytriomyces confervae]
MTTQYNSSMAQQRPCNLWKERFDGDRESFVNGRKDLVFQKQTAPSYLLGLCAGFLFGDGQWTRFSSDLDLELTNLVMVSNPYDGDGWRAKMAESMVLTASLNYFADHEPHAMIEYLSAKMFASEGSKTMSAAERNRQFRLTIAVKFMQGWRLEPGMQKFFPDWVQIAKPVGIFDYRSKDGGASMFLQQLRDSEFEWMLLPSAHAGPDLRYSVFFCSVKTTTANSTSANDYQTITEVAVPANWYKSDPAMNAQCSKELQGG